MSKNISEETLERIVKVRNLKGYSQEYMGKKLGINQDTYSKIETGKSPLSLERLGAISEVFEMSIFDLLSFDEKMLFNNYYNHGEKTEFFGTFHGNVVHANEELIKSMQKQIDHLEKEVEFYRNIISRK